LKESVQNAAEDFWEQGSKTNFVKTAAGFSRVPR
jgi:hypothetical protein